MVQASRSRAPQLTPLVAAGAPGLISLPGVGVDTAGQLLVTAVDIPGRLRAERSFARLCGVAPVPVDERDAPTMYERHSGDDDGR
jgi:transposase